MQTSPNNLAAKSGGFIDRFLFDWFPAEALGAVRFYFGLGLAIYLNIQFSSLVKIAPDGAAFHFTIPIWYFSLLGIDSIAPATLWPVRIAMTAFCILFAIGKWTKPAIIAIIVCIFYLKGVRDSISGDVHHREVPIIFCLIVFFVSKCDQMFGMDAKKKSLPPIQDWEASWPLRAMQIYIVMFYFWALMAKLRLSGMDWFTGGGRIQEMLLSRALRDGMTPDGQVVNLPQAFALSHHPETVFWIGALVFAFEFFSPLILFVRDKRLIVFFLIGATIFHLSNYFLMNVQFFFYPFVFVTFFNMAAFHVWAKGKMGLKPQPQTAPAE